jgi:RNA polymerase-binding transcription factor DksA
MIDCKICGDEIDPPERAKLKPYCLMCGEDMARAERRSWTVVKEYGKGG